MESLFGWEKKPQQTKAGGAADAWIFPLFCLVLGSFGTFVWLLCGPSCPLPAPTSLCPPADPKAWKRKDRFLTLALWFVLEISL